MYINPPHQAFDRSLLASMLNTLRTGGSLPAILVDEEGQAYSGSHRIEAMLRAQQYEQHSALELDVVIITMEQRGQIMESMNREASEEVYDFEPFLEEAKFLGMADTAA